MANKRISELPNGNLTPETIIPIVANGITSKTTLGDVTTALQSTLSVGGEVGFISITKQEIDQLMATSSLVVGTIYKISGFYKNKVGLYNYPMPNVLYDDGTNAGTTIIIQAVASNLLSSQGIGEFYNPKYYDTTTYSDVIVGTDIATPTALYGIWDGDNTIPTSIPSYSVGQVVFWGGYAWRNLNGNVGRYNTQFELNSEDWLKIQYSDSQWYNKVYDFIEIDYPRDYMVTRRNAQNDITVTIPPSPWMWTAGWTDFHAISAMCWGLYSRIADVTDEDYGPGEGYDNEIAGISSVFVSNGYCETINFKGTGFTNTKVEAYSAIYDNYLGKNLYWETNSLTGYSVIRRNKFNGTIRTQILYGQGVYGNSLDEGSRISDNKHVSVNGNKMTRGIVYGNNNNGARLAIESNSINYSEINNNSNIIGYSNYISFNILTEYSNININQINGDYININNCRLLGSNISENTLLTNIRNNELTNSRIIANILRYVSIENCTMKKTYFNIAPITSDTLKSILYIAFDSVELNSVDINNATLIYNNRPKTMFQRQDGLLRFKFYENNDTQTVTNITQ